MPGTAQKKKNFVYVHLQILFKKTHTIYFQGWSSGKRFFLIARLNYTSSKVNIHQSLPYHSVIKTNDQIPWYQNAFSLVFTIFPRTPEGAVNCAQLPLLLLDQLSVIHRAHLWRHRIASGFLCTLRAVIHKTSDGISFISFPQLYTALTTTVKVVKHQIKPVRSFYFYFLHSNRTC